MNTFVIGDIHGRHDLLVMALEKIYDYATGGTIIFLGDYIDRGPDSKQVIQTLMDGPKNKAGWNWICLRGNHEDMLLENHDTADEKMKRWWFANGGDTTMNAYDGTIQEDHLKWMNQLPRLYWDDLRVYVHAGVSQDYDLIDQPEQVTQWFRYPRGTNKGWHGKHVVHGHTPIGPERYEHRTNLDGNACYRGRLLVGVFNDAVAAPIEILEVTAQGT